MENLTEVRGDMEVANASTETPKEPVAPEATEEQKPATATESKDTAPVMEKTDTKTDEGDTEPQKDSEFNRANVEGLGNLIRLVDSDEKEGLDMFCYVKCTNEDNDLLKNCRGVVFKGDELVMKAFPYTAEYNHTELEVLADVLGTNKCLFYDSHEGALVRIFNYNNKWYLSTHRKLNAFRSKWASRESFGTLFKKALTEEVERNSELKASLSEGESLLERFQNTLDPKKQYMFLICNNKDNRIVCRSDESPRVYHVGTFVDGTLSMDENVNVPYPKKHSFLNVDEVVNYVSKINIEKLQGVICFAPDNKQFKIFNKDYQDLFRARGNEPSIKFRYLQVRMNRKMTNMLYYLYPSCVEMFDEYENTLYDIARSIYRAYVQRFIKKRYVTVPKEEFQIIRECHTWHLSNRAENRISLEQVIKVLNEQTPTSLNHMIRRFKTEQTRRKEQIDSNRPRANSYKGTKSPKKTPRQRVNSVKTPVISPLVLGVNGVPDNIPSVSLESKSE